MTTTNLWKRVKRIHKSGLSLTWNWEHVRRLDTVMAEEWRDRFQQDEPTEVFVVSENKPRAYKIK